MKKKNTSAYDTNKMHIVQVYLFSFPTHTNGHSNEHSNVIADLKKVGKFFCIHAYYVLSHTIKNTEIKKPVEYSTDTVHETLW